MAAAAAALVLPTCCVLWTEEEEHYYGHGNSGDTQGRVFFLVNQLPHVGCGKLLAMENVLKKKWRFTLNENWHRIIAKYKWLNLTTLVCDCFYV